MEESRCTIPITKLNRTKTWKTNQQKYLWCSQPTSKTSRPIWRERSKIRMKKWSTQICLRTGSCRSQTTVASDASLTWLRTTSLCSPLIMRNRVIARVSKSKTTTGRTSFWDYQFSKLRSRNLDWVRRSSCPFSITRSRWVKCWWMKPKMRSVPKLQTSTWPWTSSIRSTHSLLKVPSNNSLQLFVLPKLWLASELSRLKTINKLARTKASLTWRVTMWMEDWNEAKREGRCRKCSNST